MPPLVSLRDVSRIFRAGRETITAVDHVSFDVLPGEFVVLTGPSGSGKSVLLNLLALLDAPSSGVFRFSGQDMRERADDEITCLRNRKIGMIFQRPWMIDRLSVAGNVALPLRYRGADARKSAREARAWLERVGLLARADDLPRNLSGGQLQLAALARALIAGPEVILADEPTAALDSDAEARALRILHDASREQGAAVVLVTHDPETARTLSANGRMVEMRNGAIVADSRDATATRESLLSPA